MRGEYVRTKTNRLLFSHSRICSATKGKTTWFWCWYCSVFYLSCYSSWCNDLRIFKQTSVLSIFTRDTKTYENRNKYAYTKTNNYVKTSLSIQW